MKFWKKVWNMDLEDFLAILTYFLMIIGGAAGIGLIVVFLRKLGKIESNDKLEEEKLDDWF